MEADGQFSKLEHKISCSMWKQYNFLDIISYNVKTKPDLLKMTKNQYFSDWSKKVHDLHWCINSYCNVEFFVLFDHEQDLLSEIMETMLGNVQRT